MDNNRHHDKYPGTPRTHYFHIRSVFVQFYTIIRSICVQFYTIIRSICVHCS